MSRQFGQMLTRAAQTLFEVAGRAPEVAPTLGPVGALVLRIGADIDTHVSRRLRQGEEIKALLREARPRLAGPEAAGVDAALALELSEPEDFTLQNIEAHVRSLRRSLIQVHAWLEAPERGGGQQELIEKILAYARADVGHASRMVAPLW